MSKLKIYLVSHPIDGYLSAIEATESIKPLERIKQFNLNIRGAKLIRELGAQPPLYVATHGLYTIIQLTDRALSSLVVTLSLKEDLIICALSECEISKLDTAIDPDEELFDEIIEVVSKNVYPWTRVDSILSS